MAEKLQVDQVHTQISRCSACIHGRLDSGRPVCEADAGREIRFFDQDYACCKGFWKASDRAFMFGVSEPRVDFDEESKTLWLNKPDVRRMTILDASYKRIQDKPLRWALGDKPVPDLSRLNPGAQPRPATPAQQTALAAAHKKRSFWKGLGAALAEAAKATTEAARMAAEFALVQTSGRASDEDIATRRASCTACPVRKGPDNNPIPPGTPFGDKQWCGKCGCGMQDWAKLDRKLEFAKLPCELDRPGFFGSPPASSAT